MDILLIIILIIIVIVVIALILYVISLYNSLVTMRNRVNNAWAQVDVQLKRRNDLIPNIVETVKGYAAHEKSTLQEVTDARTRIANAGSVEEVAEADNQLTGALKTLFAVAEAYPDLKANTNFINLQEELSETEDKIAYARQFYNDTVLKYNNTCQTFPGNVAAGLFHFDTSTFFKTNEEEKAVPKVQF
ncbi:MAG: hypothetical protein BZ136_04600 [Methanosphaera sp. rholeuAM74]|nr:MAG: hypothetical protein BZ136_04600 [Methanosphaera sp. rholeuAM74]